VSIYLHTSHNVSVLLYYLVCVAKGRNEIFPKRADGVLRDICMDIAKRYEIHFLEIGADLVHVHFLIQTTPTISISPSKLAQTVKSLTARELKKRIPEIRDQLWEAALWTNGYFINTVGRSNAENVIGSYVRNQGSKQEQYTRIHSDTTINPPIKTSRSFFPVVQSKVFLVCQGLMPLGIGELYQIPS